MNLPEPLLTTADAARVIGIAERTLKNWRSAGKGPPHSKDHAGRVSYPLWALVEWKRRQLSS